MRGILLLIFFYGFSLSLLSADIKTSVCIVRSTDTEMDSVYMRWGTILQRNGYISAGRIMSRAANSYGSGFVFQSANGGRYVITNRHVVGAMKMVQLEFQTPKGIEKYGNCEVLFVDVKQDIAIVALPIEANVTALTAISTPLKDGQDVYSAGYPALGNAPLWQLGKGIVSNADVNTGNLGDKDSIFVIQHTAQVDAGNSGGPLLVRQIVEDDTTFLLAGINTWKAYWRENTNFSTRVTELEELISQYEQNSSKKNEKLEDMAQKFAENVTKGYKYVADYFSLRILLGMSDSKYMSMLKNADDYISTIIRSEDPEYGIRLLVAMDLCDKFKNVSDFKFQSVRDFSDSCGNVIFTVKKNEYSFGCRLFNDGWKIVKTNAIKSDNVGVSIGYSDYSLRRKFRGMIGATVNVPINESQGPGFLMHCLFILKSYTLLGLELGVQGTHVTAAAQYDPKCYYGFAWNINLGTQLPIRMNKVYVSPYALLGLGCEFIGHKTAYIVDYGNDIALTGVVRAGVRVGYLLANGNQIYFGAEYKYKMKPLTLYSDDRIFPRHVLGFKVGLEWNKNYK